MRDRFAILIPVHNRKGITLRCLDRLRAERVDGRFDIVVIDDGSGDGTSEEIAARFPAVTLLRGDGTLWWTGAIRLGMRWANDRGSAGVIWLNDDTIVSGVALDRIARRCVEVAGIVGPSLELVQAAREGAPGRRVATGFIGRSAVSPLDSGELAVDGLSGYCVAVSRKVWEAIGFPDAEAFPQYCGDSHYTLAARRRGFPVLLDGEVAVAQRSDGFMEKKDMRYWARRASGFRSGFRKAFLDLGSPYHWSVRFHYCVYRDGLLKGTLVSSLSLLRYAAEYSWVWLRLPGGERRP